MLAERPRLVTPDVEWLRPPPHSLEAEQSVLGAILLDNGVITEVERELEATDFYAHAHRTIYETMVSLHARSSPVDVITLAEALRSADAIERIGGLPYLEAILAAVPTAANVAHYARVVHERAELRRLAALGTSLAADAMTPGASAPELMAEARAALDPRRANVVFLRPAPVDILRGLAAPPLRAEDAPSVLGRFAESQAQATGFDVSILLAGGIVAAAAALDDSVRLCVSPRSSWFESARLWLSLIGGPGSGKTPGLKKSMDPIFSMHRELLAEWSKTNASGGEPQPDAPPRPALYTSDATTEALADVLRDNPRGLLYFCDELESWLSSHDAYRSSGGKDRGEWLRLYDGGPHQVNRIRRGAFFVQNWSASLLSATTPAALRKLAPKLPEDGLLQRILLVLVRPVELPDGAMLRFETKVPAEAWDAALRRLHAIPGDVVVHLSGGAREAFEAEQVALHGLTRSFEDLHPPYASHLAKRPAMLARIALVFHALDARDIRTDVQRETMELAIRFLRRQERHAQAVYGSMLGADTGMELAKAIARSILASELQQFNRRELTHACRAFRAADEQSRIAALSLLTDCGWLTTAASAVSHGAVWTVDGRVHSMFSEHGAAAKAQRAAIRSRLQGDENET